MDRPGTAEPERLTCRELPACIGTSCLRQPTSTQAILCDSLSARLIAVLILLLLGCAAAGICYPMRVKDARGKLVTIQRKPVRIVSLAPSNTEILYALGLNDRVVGVTKYCDYPAEATRKPKIGDMTVSAEAVIALKPDLVLAHAFVNDAAISRLERLGLTVFAIDPKTIEQVIRDIRTVGRITARPKTADSVAKRMESAVTAVKAERKGRRTARVLVVIQSSPLWVAGPKTFVDEMLGLVNARNVAHDARPGFVTFSKELAVSRNPEVIITGIAGDVGYFSRSSEWRGTRAVRRGRVRVIKSELLVRAGPRLANGLRELAKAIR